MTVRSLSQPLAAASVVALLLAGCTGTDVLVDDVAEDAAEVVDELADDVADDIDDLDDLDDEMGTMDDEHEGEARDPDALFGADVCRALLPALDGDVAGLDRYATPEVLDELSDGATGEGVALDAIVYEGEGECFISVGDFTWTIQLLGDGHVGENAVAVAGSLGLDSGSSSADVEAIAVAVQDLRDGGAACDGGAEELPEGAFDHDVYEFDGMVVVGVVCSSFAYQSIFHLYGWDGALYDLEVEQWMDGVDTFPQVLGFPFVEDGLLTNLEKARGLGDCGTFQTWGFGEGDTLVLVEARVRECDDEAEYVEPTEWELVYVADV